MLKAALQEAISVGVDCDFRGSISVVSGRRRLAELEAEAASPEKKEEAAWRKAGLLEVIAKAKAWAVKEWPETLPRLRDISFNTSLHKGGPAMLRFKEGVVMRMKENNSSRENVINTLGFFAWHGTPSPEGLTAICKEGFDPKRRKVQVKFTCYSLSISNLLLMINGMGYVCRLLVQENIFLLTPTTHLSTVERTTSA